MAASRDRFAEHEVAPLPLGRVIALFAVVFLVIFAAAIALFWRVGVFDTDTSATNGQIVAAALALVGVLVTASLTFVGVILKHSIDSRTLEQTRATEGRLRLETAIQAVELLTEDGKPGTPTRQAGALFVLVSLGQLEFAHALLGQVWANREISPGAASWVVNRLLLDGDDSMRGEAGALLDANADTLATPGGLEFPDCVTLKWRNDFLEYVRRNILTALLKALVAKPREEWDEGDIGTFTLQLDLIRRTDADRTIQNGALVGLNALLRSTHSGGGVGLPAPWGRVLLDDLSNEVAILASQITGNVPTEASLLAERVLNEWGQTQEQSTQSGANSDTTAEREDFLEGVRRDI